MPALLLLLLFSFARRLNWCQLPVSHPLSPILMRKYGFKAYRRYYRIWFFVFFFFILVVSDACLCVCSARSLAYASACEIWGGRMEFQTKGTRVSVDSTGWQHISNGIDIKWKSAPKNIGRKTITQRRLCVKERRENKTIILIHLMRNLKAMRNRRKPREMRSHPLGLARALYAKSELANAMAKNSNQVKQFLPK